MRRIYKVPYLVFRRISFAQSFLSFFESILDLPCRPCTNRPVRRFPLIYTIFEVCPTKVKMLQSYFLAWIYFCFVKVYQPKDLSKWVFYIGNRFGSESVKNCDIDDVGDTFENVSLLWTGKPSDGWTRWSDGFMEPGIGSVKNDFNLAMIIEAQFWVLIQFENLMSLSDYVKSDFPSDILLHWH